MYCPRCGTKNEDDSLYCKQCGNDLKTGTTGPVPPPQRMKKRREEECEEDCSGGDQNMAWFWGIIVIIIGAWVIFNFGVKNVVDDLPGWLEDIEFCWIVWIVVGIAIVAAGFRMIARTQRHR